MLHRALRVGHKTVVGLYVVGWCHWLLVDLQEAEGADAHVDDSLFRHVAQVLIVHREALASVARRGGLKTAGQQAAVAEDRVLRGHGRAGYFGLPACFLRVLPLLVVVSDRAVALAVEASPACLAAHSLPARSVRVSLRSFAVGLSLHERAGRDHG